MANNKLIVVNARGIFCKFCNTKSQIVFAYAFFANKQAQYTFKNLQY